MVDAAYMSATTEMVSQKLAADIFSNTQKAVADFSGNNEEVLQGSQAFIDNLREALSRGEILEHEVARILEAVRFAAEKHKDQKRKNPSQTPYIIHPIGVSRTLLTLGNVRDTDVLIGALLHDTVEDTETTFEEIRGRFGARVEGIVRELTDDKSLPKQERKRLQIVNAPHKSLEAAQIKLSDKLYNLNDLARVPPADWSQERIDEYFKWAKEVVDALPDANPAVKAAVDQVIRSHWGV